MVSITVSVIGGAGYIGSELTRLILRHPKADIQYVTSRQKKGVKLADDKPNLKGVTDVRYTNPDLVVVADDSDLIFFATAHGVSMFQVPKVIDKARIIDMSGDFRLKDVVTYERYYDKSHASPSLIEDAVYGLPELNRKQIKTAKLVANPGCYPTGALLALIPLAHHGILGNYTYINSVTGSSGSGVTPSPVTHHPTRALDMKPYKPGTHRHQPEIQQVLSTVSSSNTQPKIIFVPHSGPFVRGILTSIYTCPREKNESMFGAEELIKAYKDYYKEEPFIRVRETPPRIIHVAHSNYCDIHPLSLKESETDLHQYMVFSAIDNLIKGGAGQAIQNMNIMFGFPESTGIDLIAPNPP
ncbi:MAG: N-acetyl-gamma-glutamyl-phosphate reductase [Candidatus Ranarchaeia archaeon]